MQTDKKSEASRNMTPTNIKLKGLNTPKSFLRSMREDMSPERAYSQNSSEEDSTILKGSIMAGEMNKNLMSQQKKLEHIV